MVIDLDLDLRGASTALPCLQGRKGVRLQPPDGQWAVPFGLMGEMI